MKQIIQDLSNGITSVEDVPAPILLPSTILVESKRSLISSGTEKSLISFGKDSYLKKALNNPDRVKEVIEKLKTDGIFSTYDAVTSKLSQPLPLGYCNAGLIYESNIEDFKVGDRVLTNGPHAGFVRSTRNMTCLIPESVSFDEAPFGIIGAIALQGIRLTSPEIGEKIVVLGLGLVGLMAVQILKAAGIKVIAADVDLKRCNLAKKFGAEIIHLDGATDLINSCLDMTNSIGADGVIITASSKSNDLIYQAAKISRKRGRIVLIGEVGLNLRRDIFYEKEVTFQVSSSYGPGRYDPEYEILGKDYPIEYVRWTSKRNIETVLDLISNNEVSVKDLITTKYKINDAFDAYKELYSQNPLGIIISYDEEKKDIHTTSFEKKNIFSHNQVKPYIGFLGAGNYASRVLIPAFKKTNSNFLMVNTSSGLSSFKAAKNFFIPSASTDFDKILNNKQINTVVISTQHNLHAEQVITALQHKKNVFVEKPLAIDFKELSDIKDAYEKANSDDESYVRLMVGFNRRFAPQILKIKNLMKNKKNPSYINMMINAGSLPSNHWINNLIIGGGRVIGEACHFIDLITFLMDSKISSFHTSTFSTDNKNLKKQNVSLNLNFQNGNFGSIQYLSIGGKAFPKERIEIFCDDAVLQLDNYRVLRGFNWKSFRYNKLLKQDKGNINCVKNFVDSISSGKEAPISFEEIYHSSKLTIDISQQIK